MFTRSRRFKQKFRGRIRGRGNAGAHKLNPIVKETRARKIADPLPLDATMPRCLSSTSTTPSWQGALADRTRDIAPTVITSDNTNRVPIWHPVNILDIG